MRTRYAQAPLRGPIKGNGQIKHVMDHRREDNVLRHTQLSYRTD